ncbi:hypothetical protein S100141_05111 (plasmid) [Bacillus licheniformis]|nr:hypothetical protein S100141_05111 [Bacillus licheniformis]
MIPLLILGLLIQNPGAHGYELLACLLDNQIIYNYLTDL